MITSEVVNSENLKRIENQVRSIESGVQENLSSVEFQVYGNTHLIEDRSQNMCKGIIQSSDQSSEIKERITSLGGIMPSFPEQLIRVRNQNKIVDLTESRKEQKENFAWTNRLIENFDGEISNRLNTDNEINGEDSRGTESQLRKISSELHDCLSNVEIQISVNARESEYRSEVIYGGFLKRESWKMNMNMKKKTFRIL
jgi:hypothetical protein